MTAYLWFPRTAVGAAPATAGLTTAKLEADVSNARAEQTEVLSSLCRPASRESLTVAREASDGGLDSPSAAIPTSGRINLERTRVQAL